VILLNYIMLFIMLFINTKCKNSYKAIDILNFGGIYANFVGISKHNGYQTVTNEGMSRRCGCCTPSLQSLLRISCWAHAENWLRMNVTGINKVKKMLCKRGTYVVRGQ